MNCLWIIILLVLFESDCFSDRGRHDRERGCDCDARGGRDRDRDCGCDVRGGKDRDRDCSCECDVKNGRDRDRDCDNDVRGERDCDRRSFGNESFERGRCDCDDRRDNVRGRDFGCAEMRKRSAFDDREECDSPCKREFDFYQTEVQKENSILDTL